MSDPLDVIFAELIDDGSGSRLKPSDWCDIELEVLAVIPKEWRIVLGST